jgi:ACS family sodium-dependent inorganic phosphate cotransporter
MDHALNLNHFTLVQAQAPGGWLSSTLGGRRTLPPAVGLFSLGTALMPVAAANSMAALCLSRSVVGLGEAMAPSAIIDMMARGIPKEQRAGAISTAYCGLHGGSIVGLLISPALIDMFGWRSLFAIYGAVGMAWVLAFNLLMEDIGKQDPELKALLEAPRAGCPSTSLSAAAAAAPSPSSPSLARDRQQQASTSAPAATAADAQQTSIPYRAMLRSQPVRALMFTHLAHNWLNYTMLAWLPSYFTYTLEVDLMHAAQTALLPPLVGILASSVAGRAADSLIASGVPLPAVRKAAQCTAFLVPATLLSALWLCDGINTDANLVS